MIDDEFERKVTGVPKPNASHLNRQIAPKAHTAMYNFHKYWSRKTWNVVGEFIETYCPESGIVYDPFGGSGVTAIEALKRKRRAIISDISPLATELTRLTIKHVELEKLHDAYKRIETKVKNKILNLYKTKCRKCGREIVFDCAIWRRDKCVEIRYSGCPYCKDERRSNTRLKDNDRELLETVEKHKIKEWYPKNKLYYTNGKPFKEKQHYESIDELFTKRNLYALAILMSAIEEETNKVLKDFMKIAFTSMSHLCSRMCPISEGGHFTPFSSAWTQQSYWYPSGPYMEQNVWNKFESSIMGHQGLVKAKEESNRYFSNVKFATKLDEVIRGDADVFIHTGSCLDLMDKMETKYGNNGCVDYIFTDPPYDSSIQYGELSYMWVAWLGKNSEYLKKIEADEIIHNERQEKDFEVYHSLLKNSFEKMFSVLKSNAYLTLTFHNPTFKVRNATIRAGVLSGFELQKIHHQELARPSAKSLLQPYGSAQGDFYLRFYKPSAGEQGYEREVIDEIRFEKIVLDTTTRILAERGEPTPYTIIINAIDPELAKRGYFSELHSGLDVKTVLDKHLNNEFILVDSKVGDTKGKSWWFKDPNSVPHLQKIPLSERVENTVLRQLQSKGKVTFTDVWEAVNIAFPNSLTSDQTSIKEALEVYANQVQGGYWLIKPEFRADKANEVHSTIIAILAELGLHKGYQIYIGKKEQSAPIPATMQRAGGKPDNAKLGKYVNHPDVFTLKGIVNPEIVDDIDLLWIKDDRIEYMFEIECTTSMTSALERGSNIEPSVKKVMMLPYDRDIQFKRKMKSSMFSERFANDNWHVMLLDVLKDSWYKDRKDIDIESLFNKPTTIKKNKKDVSLQTDLFGDYRNE